MSALAAWLPDLLGRTKRSTPKAAPRRAEGAGLDGEGVDRATLYRQHGRLPILAGRFPQEPAVRSRALLYKARCLRPRDRSSFARTSTSCKRRKNFASPGKSGAGRLSSRQLTRGSATNFSPISHRKLRTRRSGWPSPPRASPGASSARSRSCCGAESRADIRRRREGTDKQTSD